MASSTKLLLLFTLLWGCDNTPSSTTKASPQWQARSVDCSNVVWNWTNTGQPFMMTWCTSCHHSDLDSADRQGAPGSYNFESYQDAVAHKDRIIARVIEQNPSPMPQAGMPPDAEMQRLYESLECGMLE